VLVVDSIYHDYNHNDQLEENHFLLSKIQLKTSTITLCNVC
jgi:hypothetical protein